ncbi:hypothetical protein Tco_1092027 [Tanacetum coccineum]|uniref:Uncharacterized protein n=1 Tax=Tanacetum coccineum TaxID=301880 RepID=A0ABQ5I9X3_9ASTR
METRILPNIKIQLIVELRRNKKDDDDWDLLLDDLDFGDILEIKGVEILPFELRREEVQDVKRGITMLNHSKAEPMRLLKDVLSHVGVTTIIVKFLILDMPIDRDTPILVGRGFLYTYGSILNIIERITSTFDGICHHTFHAAKTSLNTKESDDDDEEDYGIQRNKFGALIYVWKKAVSFLGSLPVALQHEDWKPKLWEHMTMRPDPHDPNSPDNTRRWNWNLLNQIGYGEEIDEMLAIKFELCHELYSTYEFDEVCVDDELRTKKRIKFRLCGRAFSWTLLEFAKRLGLYHSQEIEEEGFDVYFQGGLRSDEHFNAREYWLNISREENLSLSRSHASTIRKPVLRVLHQMITYGLCPRFTGYDKIQKNDLWLLSMFKASHQNGYANVAWLITRWMKQKGAGSQKESTICYGQVLDTTTLKALINSEGRLITEVPEPGVPRVAIPRPPSASMQDLYKRMGRMEIRHGAIEMMSYR